MPGARAPRLANWRPVQGERLQFLLRNDRSQGRVRMHDRSPVVTVIISATAETCIETSMVRIEATLSSTFFCSTALNPDIGRSPSRFPEECRRSNSHRRSRSPPPRSRSRDWRRSRSRRGDRRCSGRRRDPSTSSSFLGARRGRHDEERDDGENAGVPGEGSEMDFASGLSPIQKNLRLGLVENGKGSPPPDCEASRFLSREPRDQLARLPAAAGQNAGRRPREDEKIAIGRDRRRQIARHLGGRCRD